jgi:hypothetical protein
MLLVKIPVLIWLFLLAVTGAAWATRQQMLLAPVLSPSKPPQAAPMLTKLVGKLLGQFHAASVWPYHPALSRKIAITFVLIQNELQGGVFIAFKGVATIG